MLEIIEKHCVFKHLLVGDSQGDSGIPKDCWAPAVAICGGISEQSDMCTDKSGRSGSGSGLDIEI